MFRLAALAPVFAQERLGDSLDIWMKLLIAMGTIVVSIALGMWMGRVARMPNHGWRFSVVWFAILASAVIVGLGWPPKLGVDLSGGVILVYEVDPGKKRTGETIDMGELVSSISRRINPGGQKEVVVRPFGVEQVEIIIPKVDDQALGEIKRVISTSGLLEFRILANRNDHDRIIQRALAPGNAHLKEIIEGTGESARPVARWVKLNEEEFRSDPGNMIIRGAPGSREVLVIVDPDYATVTGEDLAKTSAEWDQYGQPAVGFILTSKGGQKFSLLTGKNAPDPNTGFERRLGVVLDDVLRSAPNLHSRITDHGQISGRFTEEEVNSLVGIFNAGKLPAALRREPISEQLIGPQLGADTIKSASYAMILSAVLVPMFMIIYYRFSGVVATYAMFLNVLLVVAFMIIIKAPFTLSGLAGLALTLGMAVDANVLIYERMREEKARGAALRMVIRNGFDRALTTIIDAHITTLIAATVLYWIGTDQVKGFAVTLWLGVLINIFTATFCTRVVFDLAEKLRWLKELKMMQLFKTMDYDFLGRRHLWITFSAIQIGIGLIAVYFRVHQNNLLDIDFSGGTEVEVLLREPELNISVIRTTAATVLPDVSVSPVKLTGEPEGKRYRVDTSESQLSKVKEVLKQVFQDKLATLRLTYDEIAAIPKNVPAAEPPAGETPAGQTPAARPGASQGGSAPRPRSNELALATDVPAEFAANHLLAQATQPSTETAPAATTPDTTIPATTAPASTTPTTTAPASGLGMPAFPATIGGAASQAAPAETGDPYAGGTQAKIHLDAQIEYSTLEGQIESAFEALKDQLPKVSFALTNSEGDTGGSKDWILKTALQPPQVEKLLATVQSQLVNAPAFPSSNSFGPQVAGRTTQNAIYALVTSWVLMILYIWFRFQNVSYGLAAVVSLVHDVLVALGAVALSWYVADYLGFLLIQPFKINLGSIAAFLTIIGYSVNDTIVTFDRVREVKGKSPEITEDILNLSVNQTFGRTILTTFTVFLVVLILYVAGGQELHGFAFTLLVGIICGAYSTIYIAAPLLLWFSGGHRLPKASTPARAVAAQPTGTS